MSEAGAKKKLTPQLIGMIGGGILLIGLMVALGVVYKMYNTEKTKNDANELTINDLNVEIDDLEVDLQDMNEEIEDQDLEIQEKNRLLTEKEEELVKQQERIDYLLSQNKITKKQAEEMKGKVEQLEYYIKKYQTRIEQLVEENDSLRQVILAQGMEIGKVKDDRREMESKMMEAEIQVDMGKVLIAAEFEFGREKKSGKVVEDEAFNGRRLDNFQICFNILSNPLTDPGFKDLYITIYDPTGKPYSDNGGGQSGTFSYEGSDKTYTLATGINYDNSVQQVCVNYFLPDGERYAKGKNKVSVYCEGYEIGKDFFEIK